MRLLLVLLFVTVSSLGQPCWAQGVFPDDNGKALAGVKAFDAIVQIDTWLGMTGDRALMRSNLQAAFELSLRRDGIVVDADAPNYLFCALRFAEASALVAYSYSVEYYTLASAGVHRLQWAYGGIATVGRSKLTAEDVAKDCADLVANEWLKQNPKR